MSGQSFGTREIEEEVINACEEVKEAAAVSVEDELNGRATVVYVVLGDTDRAGSEASRAELEREIQHIVEREVGIMARPDGVRFVHALPRTRSGKMLHRCIRTIAEGREIGDLSTLKNSDALEAVRVANTTANSGTVNAIEPRGGKR